jgi:hypothetical protein
VKRELHAERAIRIGKQARVVNRRACDDYVSGDPIRLGADFRVASFVATTWQHCVPRLLQ